MGLKRTDEFRQDAVRIALTSGLTRKQVADDLGVGMSTLNKWITAHRDTNVVSQEDLDLAKENERLRREIRLLREEREILKKATQFFAGLNVRSRLIVWPLFEEPWLLAMPVLEGVDRRSALQDGLRELAVVEADIAQDRLLKVLA